MWDRQGSCLASFAAHSGGVTAATWLPTGQGSLLLTAGKDAALRLWQVPASEGGSTRSGKGKAAAGGGVVASAVSVCAGHTDTVSALAVAPSGELAASGGWDGKLLLWQTGKRVVEEAEAAGFTGGAAQQRTTKKRRVGKDDAAAAAAFQQESTGSLEGHVHCVSALCWAGSSSGGSGLLASGGWDHSVRLWDLSTGRAVATYNGSKAVYAVAAAPGGSGAVLAFGGADSAVRVWDVRARGETLSVKGYTAGDGWVSQLAWRPGGGGGSEHHVASVSYDGSMRLWDLRTPVPLGALKQHSDKALSVAWWGPQTIASGGADCTLQLYELPQDGGPVAAA